MKEIRAYLSQPESDRLWSEGLALLAKHGFPQYATLYDELQVGPMGRNPTRLLQALDSLQHQRPAGPAQVVVETPKSPTLAPPKTSSEVEALLLLRRAKQRRAQCSQQFHTCNTDEERAEVCDLIDRATAEIRKQEIAVAHLQRFGTLPSPAEAEDAPLPDSEEELEREQTRCSSQILKLENAIVHLMTLPETSKKREKLPEKQDQLRHVYARKQAVRLKRRLLKAQADEENEDDA